MAAAGQRSWHTANQGTKMARVKRYGYEITAEEKIYKTSGKVEVLFKPSLILRRSTDLGPSENKASLQHERKSNETVPPKNKQINQLVPHMRASEQKC